MPLPIVNILAFTLLGVIIPIFIFAVTLLGDVINKAQSEERKIKEQQKKDFELKINDVENKIKTAKETGDARTLETQLKDLIKSRKTFELQLNSIKKKYSSVKLKEGVLFPASLLLLSILFNEITSVHTLHYILNIICQTASLSFLIIAIIRIVSGLSLVQEVSISSQEYQTQRMADAFSKALEINDEKNREELSLSFQEPNFPYTAKPEEELEIKFHVELVKGNLTQNTSVWFYVADEFGLISPPENKSWRQPSNFVVPNIRTVKIDQGKVSKGTRTPGSLKLKCPKSTGEYFIIYIQLADGYSGERKEVKILVKNDI